MSAAYDHRLGVITAPSGDLDAARDAAASALVLDPKSDLAWGLLADAQARSSDWPASRTSATRASELNPRFANHWLRLGRSINGAGHLAGGLTRDDLDALDDAWSAGATAPSGAGQHNASFHLLRKRVQYRRWEGAFMLAAGTHRDPPNWSSNADLGAVASVGVSDLDSEWWFAAGWKLQSGGEFRLAELARQRMAESFVDAMKGQMPSARGTADLVRAYIRLGHDEQVDRLMHTARRQKLTRIDQTLMAKLGADIQFRRTGQTGTPPPDPRGLPSTLQDAEMRFRSLIEGRTVAIVGPAPPTAHAGSEIDAHDVVIRTKFMNTELFDSVEVGTRTDIAYYSDSSAAVLRDRLDAALTANSLRMAVLRPTMLQQLNYSICATPGVRISPAEDLTTFQSARFAVPRILHDIAQYEPAAVSIFNVTLFTGRNAYVDGYGTDAASAYDPRQLLRVLPMYGHDIGSDFVFMQDLHRAHTFRADTALDHLLSLSLDDYLGFLERGHEHPASPT